MHQSILDVAVARTDGVSLADLARLHVMPAEPHHSARRPARRLPPFVRALSWQRLSRRLRPSQWTHAA